MQETEHGWQGGAIRWNLQTGQWPARGVVMVPAQERLRRGTACGTRAGWTRRRRVRRGDRPALTPQLGRALAGLGQTFIQQGLMNAARAPLEQAVAVEPARPEHWEQLGRVCDRAEDYAAAIHCWQRVIGLGGGDRRSRTSGWAGPCSSRAGWTRRRPPSAPRRAWSRSPPIPSSAWACSRWSAAASNRPRPPSAPPSRCGAIARSAYYWLANLLGSRLPDADLDALRTLTDDPRTGEDGRTRLLFALGHVLDARGQHALAAPRFRAANALQLARLRVSRPFDPAEHERLIGEFVRVFDRAYFDRLAGGGLDTRQPVFVIGLPRSGTTLVEQILASHPAVHGAGELLWGRRTFEALPSLFGRPLTPAECVPLLTPEIVRGLAKNHLERLRALAGDRAERIVDKLPDN